MPVFDPLIDLFPIRCGLSNRRDAQFTTADFPRPTLPELFPVSQKARAQWHRLKHTEVLAPTQLAVNALPI
jgi:hypothetical protein